MNKRITKISLFIWILAVAGFLSSTLHYHDDGLHCDDHETEFEYTANTTLCSICAFTYVNDSSNTSNIEVSIVQEDTISLFYSLIIKKPTRSFTPERAPPFAA